MKQNVVKVPFGVERQALRGLKTKKKTHGRIPAFHEDGTRIAGLFYTESQRGVFFHVRRMIDGKQYQVALGVTTLEAALVRMAEFEADPDGFLASRGARHATMLDLIEEYMNRQRAAKVSDDHIDRQEVELRFFCAFAPKKAVRVTKAHAQLWLDAMAQRGLGNGTIDRYWRMVRSFWIWATDNEKVPRDPLKGLTPPKPNREVRDTHRIITLRELRRLALCLRPHHASTLKLLWATGIRPVELWNMQPNDVNPDGRYIWIRPSKTKRGRAVPAEPAVIALALRFFEKKPGKAFFAQAVNRAWIWERTKVKPFRLYDLRHSRITEWVNQGVPLQEVQRWAGHSSLAMTERYVHAAKLKVAPETGLNSTMD